MSEEKRVLELDQYEHRAVVNIINEKRTICNEKHSISNLKVPWTEVLLFEETFSAFPLLFQ